MKAFRFPAWMSTAMVNGRRYVADANNIIRVEDEDAVEAANQGALDAYRLEWDDLRFPAQAINPVGGVGDPAVDTVETSFPGTLLFSGTQDNLVAGMAQMPHEWAEGTHILPHIHWAKTTSAAGNVVWEFYYRLLNRGAAPEAWVGPVTGVLELNHNDIADAEGITTFGTIFMRDRRISQNLAWRIYRRGASGLDTYDGAAARLFEFDIHFQRDAMGSREERTK